MMRPRRVLVVMPSWLGDAVMATPALRLLRRSLPGAYIGGLVRPGIEELMAGTAFFDEVHVGHSQGLMGPKRLAGKVRGRGYDTALLLTNSFSTALAARLAFIPRRVGYDRDGRGMLLTERLSVEKRADGRFACVSAVEYYLRIAREIGKREEGRGGAPTGGPVGGTGGEHRPGDRSVAREGEHRPGDRSVARLELGVTEEQERGAAAVLARAGVGSGEAYAVVNPGANDVAKRWPAERFGAVADHLARTRGWMVLVNGGPGDEGVCEGVKAQSEKLRAQISETRGVGRVVSLVGLGGTIGTLKGIVRGARVMVTNDTGPRHIAAAFGVPTVTLFGPTDPGWTTLPETGVPHAEVVAEPGLPEGEIADDHPDLCRIDKIGVERVVEAVERVLAESGRGSRGG